MTWDKKAIMKIYNDMGRDMYFTWVDYEGNRYGDATPCPHGTEWNQSTFETHTFAVSNDPAGESLHCLFYIKGAKQGKGCSKTCIDMKLSEAEGLKVTDNKSQAIKASVAENLVGAHNYVVEDINGWQVHIHDKI